MDNIFKSIRSLFGHQTEVSEAAIDVLDGVNIELDVIEDKIEKAMQDFDHANDSLSLKISACDMLIEKGNDVGADNKGYLVDKLNRVTSLYHEGLSKLVEQKKEIEGRKVDLESEIISKSIEIVASLSDDNQSAIKNIIDAWHETGLIKGEEIEDQLKAMTFAIDEIVKGGEVVVKKKVKSKHSTEQLVAHAENTSSKRLSKVSQTKEHPHSDAAARELERRKAEEFERQLKAKSKLKKGEDGEELEKAQRKQDKDSVVGHYANAIVRKYVKEGDSSVEKILFLKRAANKVVAPNQYCLPGGHIDEGETVDQAARRELKEEANLPSNYSYVCGKAKCADGKWAFYANVSTDHNEVALLDGESINAEWMCEDEWMKADLIFDLKEHLKALEHKEEDLSYVRDIMKPVKLEVIKG